MIRERALQRRQKLIEQLPVTGELVRGTLLNRIVRHKSGCPKCERGEGHAVSVLTISYGGGRTQQFRVRRERVAEVQRWLSNYQKLKDVIASISGIPSFFAVARNKRSKSAANFSEKNRKEPIKRARAGGVREKVEYRLDE